MAMAAVANDVEPNSISVEEGETGGDDTNNNNSAATIMATRRKEKRKMLKKMKRKQLRREKALKEREEEEARLNDPEEQLRLLRLEKEEAERMERDRREFEEREMRFLQELELKKKREEEEEEQRRKLREESRTKLGDNENANELDEDDDWEYVEEGPAEIIWKGNEIIVKKKTVRVRKKSLDPQNIKQESDRPISNPLAPQYEAFEDYKSAREVLESVAQQVPNFGTEQDKAHCPFHLKTGVCRFGARCSRVHFYPDKSCTLLMKNMYGGPGLACEQDEGLEYTDEEVERSFEDFYEDVHTEFLKFGEIVNFKVCKNSSSHLRGNVYVHYKSLESAVLAYQSINGRYFAGKQISCEFVNVTRWKVAICGEYMKSRLRTCSRGSACNFIHCFRNPGGDYEWADWDKPAPRYWLKKMASLFGYNADRLAEENSPSYGPRRSRSRGPGSAHRKSHSDEDDDWKRGCHRRHRSDSRERLVDVEEEMHEEKMNSQRYHCDKRRKIDAIDMSDGSSDEQRSFARRKRSRKRERGSEFIRESKNGRHEPEFDKTNSVKKGEDNRYLDRRSRSSRRLDHYSRDKVDAVNPKESSHAERHHDKYHGHKSKHSVHRKEETDSSDVDSYKDRRDREKHRHHSHSKRSSRDRKYDAEISDSASDGEIGRDGTKHQKNGRRNSRSKNEPDLVDTQSNRGRRCRDERRHGHGRRSSGHHSEESGLSNVDSNACKNNSGGDCPDKKDGLSESHICGNDSKRSSCGTESCEGCDSQDDRRYDVEHISQINESTNETTASQTVIDCLQICGKPESELEQAYRLAALKKLEEMRKSKDSQPDHNAEHVNSARNSHDSQGVAVQGDEVSKGPKEPPDSSKMETKVVSAKRRRI